MRGLWAEMKPECRGMEREREETNDRCWDNSHCWGQEEGEQMQQPQKEGSQWSETRRQRQSATPCCVQPPRASATLPGWPLCWNPRSPTCNAHMARACVSVCTHVLHGSILQLYLRLSSGGIFPGKLSVAPGPKRSSDVCLVCSQLLPALAMASIRLHCNCSL